MVPPTSLVRLETQEGQSTEGSGGFYPIDTKAPADGFKSRRGNGHVWFSNECH